MTGNFIRNVNFYSKLTIFHCERIHSKKHCQSYILLILNKFWSAFISIQIDNDRGSLPDAKTSGHQDRVFNAACRCLPHSVNSSISLNTFTWFTLAGSKYLCRWVGRGIQPPWKTQTYITSHPRISYGQRYPLPCSHPIILKQQQRWVRGTADHTRSLDDL